MFVRGMAAFAPGIDVAPYTFEIADPARSDVVVSVTHCGVGRGDVHFLDGTFALPASAYPMVAGCELVGHVVAVGPSVHDLNVGNRVGVGHQVGCCGSCLFCVRGDDNLCQDQRLLIVHQPGGFATHVTADSRFVTRVPGELSNAEAAPLFNAGVTAYSAVRRSQASAGSRVGVVGIGGLGHLALQFLAALGCKTTAITNKPPRTLAGLPPSAVLPQSDISKSETRSSFDVIIVTSSGSVDWANLIRMLTPDGRLVVVGSPAEPVTFPVELLNDLAQRAVIGSYIGNAADRQGTVDTAAATGVRPRVDVLPLSRLGDALDLVSRGAAAFRVVVENDMEAA